MRNTRRLGGRFVRTAVLAFAATSGLSGCTLFAGGESPQDDSGQETTEAHTAAADLQLGDCMSDSGTAVEPDIAIVPCSDEHAAEVFAVTELAEGEYPGNREADAQAQAFCSGEFADFVGVDYDSSELLIEYFYPLEESWGSDNGRKVSCLVTGSNGEALTGTLQNANR